MQSATRTVSYRLKCEDNRALHELILERRAKFEERAPESQNPLRAMLKAAKAVRSHPLPIRTKGQFAEIKDIGPFTVKQFAAFSDERPAEAEGQEAAAAAAEPPAKKRKTAAYVPKLNSAPYALLITMYRAQLTGKMEYRREDLIQDADNSGLSEKPIGQTGLNGQVGRQNTHSAQDFYTGWSCMSKQLIGKGLVLKQGNPPTYYLTEYGEATARECMQRSSLPDAPPMPHPAPPAADLPPRPPAATGGSPASRADLAAAAAAAAEARAAQNTSQGRAGPASRSQGHTTAPPAVREGRGGETREGGISSWGGKDSEEEPHTSTPVAISEETVQKLVCLGFSPVRSRHALAATHVAGVPESPWVEQAANWLLENDSPDAGPSPPSPVQPSFSARMAGHPPPPPGSGRYDHLFASGPEAGPSAVPQGAGAGAGRPPSGLHQQRANGEEAGPSGARPATVRGTQAAGRSPCPPPSGGAVPLRVRVPPLGPGERFSARYSVVCLVDHREYLVRKLSPAAVLAEFTARGLTAEVRTLELGDVLWLARDQQGSAEYVLDYVAERKRVDDLSSSISSSRYQRQKHFLDSCGLRRRIYLLEDDAEKMDDCVRIKTACINTELVNGFDIQRTVNAGDTLRRLVALTAAIQDALHARTAPLHPAQDEALPTFTDFDRRAKASRKRTAADLWGLMLTQVGGIGSDSANVILQQYPTAAQLFAAYRILQDQPEAVSKQLVAKLVRNAGGLRVGNKASENLYKFMYDRMAPEEDDV